MELNLHWISNKSCIGVEGKQSLDWLEFEGEEVAAIRLERSSCYVLSRKTTLLVDRAGWAGPTGRVGGSALYFIYSRF